MLVYRIQHAENGMGMYSTGHARDEMRCADDNPFAHPGPIEDMGLQEVWCKLSYCSDRYISYHFGFATYAQMRQWVFKEYWRDVLHEDGFEVVVYDCEAGFAHAGDTQAIFHEAHAVVLERLSIETAFSRRD